MAEDFKIKSKQDLLDFLKVEIAPVVKDVVEERMTKSDEARAASFDERIAKAFAASKQADEESKKSKSRKAAEYIFALAKGREPGKAAEYAKAQGWQSAEKALSTGTVAGGGLMIPVEFGPHIEGLYANSVVRELGAEIMPMPSGSLTMSADNALPTTNWVGESQNGGSSAPTQRGVSLAAKKAVTIVPIPNELLKDTSGKALDWVERKAMQASGLAEDLAFLRGLGSAYAPKGMLYWVASANSFNRSQAGAASTAAEIFKDLGKAIYLVATQNVPLLRGGWAFHPRIEWTLKTILNSNGVPYFMEQMKAGELWGFPFRTTTQIPINLDTSGAGTGDESDVYFADFASCYVGETGEMDAMVVDGAAYYNSDAAAVVSGLSRDETVVKLSRRVDFSVGHQGNEIGLIRSVDWTPTAS